MKTEKTTTAKLHFEEKQISDKVIITGDATFENKKLIKFEVRVNNSYTYNLIGNTETLEQIGKYIREVLKKQKELSRVRKHKTKE